MAGVFQAYRSAEGIYRWRLRDEAGDVVLTSTGFFPTMENAKDDAKIVAGAATGSEVVEA